MRIPLPTTANDALNQGWNSGAQMIQNLAENQIRRNTLMQEAQLENARMAQQNRQFQQTFGLDTQRFNADQAYKKQLLAMQLKQAANAAQAAADAHKEAVLKYDPQAWANYLGGLQKAGNALDARMAQNQSSASPAASNALPIDTGSMSAMPAGQALAYQDDSVPLRSAATASATPMGTNATSSLGASGLQSSSGNFLGSGMSPSQFMYAKALGINPMETPQAKVALAEAEARARAEATQEAKENIEQNKSNIKAAATARNNIQNLKGILKNLDTMDKVIDNSPQIFHYGSNLTKIGSNNPDYGTFDTAAAPLISELQKNWSAGHGGKFVLQQVQQIKPNRNESAAIAKAKTSGFRKQILDQIKANQLDYSDATGGRSFSDPEIDNYLQKYDNPSSNSAKASASGMSDTQLGTVTLPDGSRVKMSYGEYKKKYGSQ